MLKHRNNPPSHALTLAAKVRTTKGWATAGRSAERALVLVAARTAVRDAMRAAAENMIGKTNRTVEKSKHEGRTKPSGKNGKITRDIMQKNPEGT